MSAQTKRRNKFIQIKGGSSLPTAKKNKCRKKSLSSKQKSHGIYKNITFLREQYDRSRMRKILEANRTLWNEYYGGKNSWRIGRKSKEDEFAQGKSG